jgi:hypothetical protein
MTYRFHEMKIKPKNRSNETMEGKCGDVHSAAQLNITPIFYSLFWLGTCQPR